MPFYKGFYLETHLVEALIDYWLNLQEGQTQSKHNNDNNIIIPVIFGEKSLSTSTFRESMCIVSELSHKVEILQTLDGERSGLENECLTRDRGAVYSSLTGVTALCL